MGDLETQPTLRERIDAIRRSRSTVQWIGIGLVVLAAVVVMAIWEGDLPEVFHHGIRGVRSLMAHYSFLLGFVLLYLEESGIPLPAPGDVFVMYVGVHIPHNIGAWLLAWLGLILAVVLGATNLFLLSRRFGRRLVQSDLAEYVHLTPERLEKAEAWFKRYGVVAIIFGRHIPGFRVPITVAAGTLGVSYRVFAPSVAVSTAIWAGVMLTLGMTLGPRLAVLLQAHTWLYFIWGGIVFVLVVSIYVRQRLRRGRLAGPGSGAGAGERRDPKRPVESPSS